MQHIALSQLSWYHLISGPLESKQNYSAAAVQAYPTSDKLFMCICPSSREVFLTAPSGPKNYADSNRWRAQPPFCFRIYKEAKSCRSKSTIRRRVHAYDLYPGPPSSNVQKQFFTIRFWNNFYTQIPTSKNTFHHYYLQKQNSSQAYSQKQMNDIKHSELQR